MADDLFGSDGQDWFLAYAIDRKDKKANELVN